MFNKGVKLRFHILILMQVFYLEYPTLLKTLGYLSDRVLILFALLRTPLVL